MILFTGALTLGLIVQGYRGFGMADAKGNDWEEIDQGFSIGVFDSPRKSNLGDSKIIVVRIDPRYYSLKLLCASEHDAKPMTTREWSQKYQLLAAINAGMYQEDELTSVGYMKNFNHVNNSGVNGNNSVLAFNRRDSSVPQIQIIDRKCQDFQKLKGKYDSLVQSIRMISCRQKNVWKQQPEVWSTAAMGIDKSGNALLLFTQSPYSVHDFIDILLSLPISIHNAMYLEGGPHASLYVSLQDFNLEKNGLKETSFGNGSPISFGLPIPNVIGVVRRELK
jgi:uncharacterized protein YigE (DUF2233 family)